MARTIDEEIRGLIKKAITDMPGVSQMDKDYVLGERWVCDDSTSGAHYWVETDERGKFKCKFCHGSRKFPLYYGNRPFTE